MEDATRVARIQHWTAAAACALRERPDMMSASEGGGGSWKSGRSKGGCVNFILQISSKCGQGGRGSKNQNILWMSLMDAPYINT